MVKITQEEFQRNTVKLSYIIMIEMYKPCNMVFTDLNNHEKKLFNKKLNEYINNLLDDDWEAQITSDFHEVCQEYLFTKDFDPLKHVPPNKVSSEITYLNPGENYD